jgi:hypothetical protein
MNIQGWYLKSDFIRQQFNAVLDVDVYIDADYSEIPSSTIFVWSDTNNRYEILKASSNPVLPFPTRHIRLAHPLYNVQANTTIKVRAFVRYVALPNELYYYNTTTNSFQKGVDIDFPAGGFTIKA